MCNGRQRDCGEIGGPLRRPGSVRPLAPFCPPSVRPADMRTEGGPSPALESAPRGECRLRAGRTEGGQNGAKGRIKPGRRRGPPISPQSRWRPLHTLSYKLQVTSCELQVISYQLHLLSYGVTAQHRADPADRADSLVAKVGAVPPKVPRRGTDRRLRPAVPSVLIEGALETRCPRALLCQREVGAVGPAPRPRTAPTHRAHASRPGRASAGWAGPRAV